MLSLTGSADALMLFSATDRNGGNGSSGGGEIVSGTVGSKLGVAFPQRSLRQEPGPPWSNLDVTFPCQLLSYIQPMEIFRMAVQNFGMVLSR